MSILKQNTQESAELLKRLITFSETIENAADNVANTLRSGGRLLACGNGGSAAEAAHLTTELVVRYKNDRRAYAALCLNAHGGDLTAIGNDYEFDRVFERQVEAFGRPADCLVVFSSSGQSKNILLALEQAKALGLKTIALLGKDGGICSGKADHEMRVSGASTARIQEAHLLLLHTLCDLVEKKLGHE
jgi:phosphoheptose isomerase|tara:strand:+ start:517 stop:1083 length:567 start_codon:yes stop_codon:yes gene_type:complete